MNWRQILIGIGGLALMTGVTVRAKTLIDERTLNRELAEAVAEYRKEGLPWTESDVLQSPAYRGTAVPTFDEAIGRVDAQAFRAAAPNLDDLANRHDYSGLEDGLRPFRATIGSALRARPTSRPRVQRDLDFGAIAPEIDRWEALTAIGHLLRLEARLEIGQGHLQAGCQALLADEGVASAFLPAHPGMYDAENLNTEVVNLADTVEACLPCLQTSTDLKAIRYVLSSAPTPPSTEDLLARQAYETIPALRNADIYKLGYAKFEANRRRLRRDGMPKEPDDKQALLGYIRSWTAAKRATLGSPVLNPSYEASLRDLQAKSELGIPTASPEYGGITQVRGALHRYTASSYQADSQIECVDLLIGALIQRKTTGRWPSQIEGISRARSQGTEPQAMRLHVDEGTFSVTCQGHAWTPGETPYDDVIGSAGFPPLPFKERTTGP